MTRQKNTVGALPGRQHVRVLHAVKKEQPVRVWLDLANESLKAGEKSLDLTPKAFAVLRYLHEHSQRLITKQELFDAVWTDTYVTDGVLKNSISEIRQALQDSSTTPRYIETVHRRGYRLLTPLLTTPSDSNPQPSHTPLSISTPQPLGIAALLTQVLEFLQQEVRVTYRILQRRFVLTDEDLADLKNELIVAKRVAIDEEGQVLVWIGNGATAVTDENASEESIQLATPNPQHLPGERRQLTVMCCDMVGAAILSAQLDPEEFREMVQTYTRLCSEIVARYEGHIAQYLGDGVLVYFGYPLTHEDEARRAVQAGLDLLAAVQKRPVSLAGREPLPLQVRIGIHTGPVVIDALGSGNRTERVALGETLNIAARLQALTKPDTIVISAATQHLVNGYFVCEPLSIRARKELVTPGHAYRVIGESPRRSRLDIAITAGLSPLVGRDGELGLLRQHWEHAKSGQGNVVMVNGEPGIGKSRLAHALKETVTQEGIPALTFRCSPYHQHTALYPILEHLQSTLQFRQEDAPQDRLTKLRDMLSCYRFPQTETLSLFASLLSLPHPEGYPSLALTSQRQRQKVQEALIAWLVEEAERTSLYIIWEDLHWADPSTLEVLTLYLDQIPTTRTLIVLTYRPEFVPPWGSRSYISHMTLSALSRPHRETMVRQIVGANALPTDLVRHIAARTDGIPLFVEELTKMVLETVGEEQAQHAAPPALPIPGTLQDALLTRLDRLGPARETAQFGAVLGREFSYELIQAVGVIDEKTLQHTLPRLVEAEIVYQRGLGPQARYTFKHALIQDAAYQSLLKSVRQQHHQHIVRTLEERFPETRETQPELLAYHCTAAALTEQAITYWQVAGQRAITRSANIEAIQHLNMGLALLKTLPQTPECLRQELGLQMTLGGPLMAVKGYTAPEVEQVYTRARTLCQTIGSTPQLAPVLWGLCAFHQVRGLLPTALELAEQVFAVAQQFQDPDYLAAAHYAMGSTHFWMGDFTVAHGHMEQSVAMSGPLRHQAQVMSYGQDFGVTSGSFPILSLWLLGYPDQALRQSATTLALPQAAAHPYSRLFALYGSAILHGWLSQWTTLHTLAETITGLATEHDLEFYLAVGSFLKRWANLAQHQHERKHSPMQHDLAVHRQMGAVTGQACALGVQAQACLQTGHTEDGLRIIAEAFAHIERTNERWYEAEVWRMKGELTLAETRDWGLGTGSSPPPAPSIKPLAPREVAQEAEGFFLKALEVARRQQAKSWELRATTSLARLWRQRGKSDAAYNTLSAIYSWFREGFATPDLQEAKTLLDALSYKTKESSIDV